MPRFAEVPSGPVVESYPMMRSAPMMMTMPVMPMMVSRSVPYEDTRPRDLDTTCSSSKNRIDDLDERVEALHVRLMTVQRAVEIQTRILEELKAQGTIGNKAIPRKEM